MNTHNNQQQFRPPHYIYHSRSLPIRLCLYIELQARERAFGSEEAMHSSLFVYYYLMFDLIKIISETL